MWPYYLEKAWPPNTTNTGFRGPEYLSVGSCPILGCISRVLGRGERCRGIAHQGDQRWQQRLHEVLLALPVSLATFCLQDAWRGIGEQNLECALCRRGPALAPPGPAVDKSLVPRRSNPVVISPFVPEGSSSLRKQKGGPIVALYSSPRVSAIPSGFLSYRGS